MMQQKETQMSPPSAWTIQAVLSIAAGTLNRMEAEGTLSTDETELMSALREDGADVDTLLLRLARAQDEATRNNEAVNARMDALRVRASRFHRQREEYRGAIYGIFDVLGVTKWKHAEFSVSLSEGKPGVVITDEAALPDEFVRISRSPDKSALAEALRSGQVIPGAEMRNSLPTLTIRTK
jgi:hypothetical protein